MSNNLLFVDIETFYDSKNGYDLRKMSMVEYIRDPRFKVQGCAISLSDQPPFWLAGEHQAYLNDYQGFIIVGHNIKFDGLILKEKFGIQPKGWIDTKALAKAVLGKRVKGFSLQQLAEHFGLQAKGHLNTDGKLELTEQEEKELADYCIHDVELCKQIYERLIVDFPREELEIMSWTVEAFVNPKLELNVPLLEKASEQEKKRRETIFAEIGIDKKEFASNKKFPELLTVHGYEVPTKLSPRTKKSIPALALGDEAFLELLESEDEDLKRLCEARVAAKSTLLETRSEKLAKIGKTGLWPFDVEYSGATQTHRFSGGKGAGGNPQNFTRNSALREAVQAPKGYKLVVGDFGQIEMRLVAYLSKDPSLIDGLEKDTNLYCDFASFFYKREIIKYDPITGKETPEYKFGKTAILGLGYNMGPKKFKKSVRLQTGQTIEDEEASRAVRLYRSRYSKVPALWECLNNNIRYMREDGRLIFNLLNEPKIIALDESFLLPSGLQVRYPNLRQFENKWIYDIYDKGQFVQRELYGGKLLENICQALAGEMCKDVIRQFSDVVVGQIHDEVILCVPEEDAEMYAYELEKTMTKAPIWLPKIKLKAEVGIGANWREAK